MEFTPESRSLVGPARARAANGNSMLRNLILAVVLGVIAFFWIWFFEYLGAKAYWVALVSFAVCLASGPTIQSLPYLTLAGVVGVVFGLMTFVFAMLVLPLYYEPSWAIAGALIILVAGLISIPKLRPLLPMLLVGWGCFLGAMARFDYLISGKPVEAIPKTLSTFTGVLLSVLVGVLLAAMLNAFILSPGRARVEAGTQGR